MILGIDLGTTNCLGVIRRNGVVELVPNEFDEIITPTVIHIGNDNELSIGSIAAERRITDPTNTLQLFKRDMGNTVQYSIKGNAFTPEDLSSLMIRHLIKTAESFTGEKVDEVVVSVPAYFTDAQRVATRNSARMCGVTVNRIINEPSAASLAYYTDSKEDGVYLVFDLGGGTLDITIVDIFDEVVDIVAISGDTHLGGTDFDAVIADAFIRKHSALENVDDESRAIIYKQAERLKIQLSTCEVADMVVRYKDVEYCMQLTQQELTQLCGPLLGRIMKVVQTALRNSGYTAKDITEIVAVGGSSKSYVVREFLEEITHLKINTTINPDEAIVRGIGDVIGIMQRDPMIKDVVLTDVCPFSMGVGIVGDVYSPIIERNMSLPTSRTRSYVTIRDNQNIIEFQVYQGEHMIASWNTLLDTFEVSVPLRPKGSVVVFTEFSYDINGILNVNFKGNDFELDQSHVVYTNNQLSEEDIVIGMKRINEFKEHDYQYTPKQEWLLSRASALYSQMDEARRAALLQQTSEFREALAEHGYLLKHGPIERNYQELLETYEKLLESVFDIDGPTKPKSMN